MIRSAAIVTMLVLLCTATSTAQYTWDNQWMLNSGTQYTSPSPWGSSLYDINTLTPYRTPSTYSRGSDVYVNGYFRSDGIYVQPHYRTAPNGTRLDNYSTRGNYNPYTGRIGTRSRY